MLNLTFVNRLIGLIKIGLLSQANLFELNIKQNEHETGLENIQPNFQYVCYRSLKIFRDFCNPRGGELLVGFEPTTC